jgi:hypothetical protein
MSTRHSPREFFLLFVIGACSGAAPGPTRQDAGNTGSGTADATASTISGAGSTGTAKGEDAGGGAAASDASRGAAGASGGSQTAGAKTKEDANRGGAGSGGSVETGGTGGSGTCAGAGCGDAGASPDAPTVCVPYRSTCMGEAVSFCNYDGTGIAAVVPCDPGDSCTVQDTTGTCGKIHCQVGRTCKDGTVIQAITCFAGDVTTTFHKEILIDDCPSKGLTCGDGIQCVPKICEPGRKSCKSSTVAITCTDYGDRWMETPCASPNQCMSGTCGIPVCTPNQPTCDGTIATVCSADGSKVLEGGTPCAEAGKICDQGACVECWPTTAFCSGATVRHCSLDGKSSTLSATCSGTQACDPATGMCKDKVCAPGKPECNGEMATTCNEDGSGYATGGTSCAEAGKHCSQGVCAALACAPNAVFCEGATVKRCASDGQSASVVQTCGASAACDKVSLTCKPLFCSPRQTTCQGNWMMTCNEDGSDWAASGQYCPGGSGGICMNGKCTGGVVTCQSGKYFCQGNLRVSCYSNGWAYPSDGCTDLEYCDSASATCMPRWCIPSQPACNGNNTTVCSLDGLGYTREGTSCGTQHCVDGTCRNTLFIDDFEDADLVGWAIRLDGQLAKTHAITSDYAAAGTRYALAQTNNSMVRAFAKLQPKRVSWWAMAESRTVPGGTFDLRTTEGSLAKVSFNDKGILVLTSGLASKAMASISFAAKHWYNIELRNLDFTAKTYDFYVNDTLVLAAAKFGSASSSDSTAIASLELATSAGSTVYWDEITFD